MATTTSRTPMTKVMQGKPCTIDKENLKLRIDFQPTWDEEQVGLVLHGLRSQSWAEVRLCNAREGSQTSNFRLCLQALCGNMAVDTVVIWRCNLEVDMLRWLSKKTTLGEVHLHPMPPGGWPVAMERIEHYLKSNTRLESLGLIRLTDSFLFSILRAQPGSAIRHLSVGLTHRTLPQHQPIILDTMLLNKKLSSLSFENFTFTDDMIATAARSGLDRLQLVRCKFPSREGSLLSTNSRELSLHGSLKMNMSSLLSQSPLLRKLHVSVPTGSTGRRFLRQLFCALETTTTITCVSFQRLDAESANLMNDHMPKWPSVQQLDIVEEDSAQPSVTAFRRNAVIVRTNVKDPTVQWYTKQRNQHLRDTISTADIALLPTLISASQSDLGPTLVAARLLTFL